MVSPVRRFRAVQVVPVLRAQEAVAFGQDLEHAQAAQHHVGIEQILLDPEDQILFAEAGEVGEVQLLGQILQLADALALQFGDVHGRSLSVRRAPGRGGRIEIRNPLPGDWESLKRNWAGRFPAGPARLG
jgi:hypothetical protein